MLIKVTQDHILDGVRKATGLCPVALAVSRAKGYPPEAICAIFPEDCFIFTEHASSQRIPLPRYVTKRIRHYDDTGEMEPFEFELPI